MGRVGQPLATGHFIKSKDVEWSATAPRGIEYENRAGSNAGKNQLGIVELHGDVLRICMSPPGKPRPTDFSSTPGDKRSFTTWRRMGGS